MRRGVDGMAGDPEAAEAEDRGQSVWRRVRGWMVLAADAIATAVGLTTALWLRLEGSLPALALQWLAQALLLFVGVRLVCNAVARIHRWSFRWSGLPDALRVVAAGLAGTGGVMALGPTVLEQRLPWSVAALELFVTTALFGALRFAPRVALRWRSRLWPGREPERALAVGHGAAAELLARQLQGEPAGRYQLVGFVSRDAGAVGWHLSGVPVLGTVEELPALLRRHRASAVLLSDPAASLDHVQRLLDLASACHARFTLVRSRLEPIDRAPEPSDDLGALLARPAVPFDEPELRALIQGRRAMVTGAGGSIGSELCRQLARLGVAQLVMLDMNENELYLGARRLAEAHPRLDVYPIVVDVREEEPLQRLGMRFRPQDVFHAAAHKHVPLMEEVPEEAVKNNVFGTLHVASMAHRCGAERFVLVSTDKAVRPSSVMGATKRIAELVVRHVHQTSATQMTAVRFGNVLGSAGSVVPLFRQQIARGGPVTVTHPDCTRFFMTIPEAVGLILRAGLGGYGELCVLDMGAPVRIDDLARRMITLSGHIVGAEIPIVYTGLRPGEKLTEELLTEEEERTCEVRHRIHVARCGPPPENLPLQMAALWAAAQRGDRQRLLDTMRALVPTFRPTEPASAGDASLGRASPAPSVAWATSWSDRS